MNMVNAFDPHLSGALDSEDAALLERRMRVLGPAYRLFYEHPLHIVRAEGVWLYDKAGRQYLDAYNNVACVGHCHPAVVSAIATQAAKLNTHTRYLHESIVEYAEALMAYFPKPLENLMLTCTGGEANDLALRIARAATCGEGLIVTANAYHGVTQAMAQASPSLGAHNPLGAHVWAVPPPIKGANESVSEDFAAGVTQALLEMQTKSVKPMALLIDSVFSSDGLFVDPTGFLKAAIAQVREAGALLIADEVQAGFGRLGEKMWGFERHGLVPDLVTLGKPMGNGHPIAGVIGQAPHIGAFADQGRYFNTFAGNPVSCAAAKAVLEVLQREHLMQNALEVGQYLRKKLQSLADAYACIADIRGSGLFFGVEIVDPHGQPATTGAARIVNRMRESGVLISATGPKGNVLKIRPPLVFEQGHADQLIDSLKDAINTL